MKPNIVRVNGYKKICEEMKKKKNPNNEIKFLLDALVSTFEVCSFS